LIHKV